MEGIGSFVHSTIQQFGDAKLLDVPSYFIRRTTQNVICLKEEEREGGFVELPALISTLVIQ